MFLDRYKSESILVIERLLSSIRTFEKRKEDIKLINVKFRILIFMPESIVSDIIR